jgi:hypothetical protein
MVGGMSTMGGGGLGSMAGVTGTVIVGPSGEQIATVFDCWLTIIFAVAGGSVARYVANRNVPVAVASREVSRSAPS